MARKNDNQKKQTGSVHRQVMRRVLPIVVVVFALFALVGSVIFQSSVRVQVEQKHDSDLAERSDELNNLIALSMSDAQSLANQVGRLLFIAQTPTSTDEEVIRASLINMERDMLSVMSDNLGLYLSARFVQPDGSVWMEVESVNGVLTPNSVYRPGELAEDSLIERGLESPAVTLGPIVVEARGDTPQTVMRVFAPVVDLNSTTDLLGVIDLTVSVSRLLNIINEAVGLDQQRWILVNNQGRYLADSASPALSRNLAQTTYRTVEEIEPDLWQLLQNNPDGLHLSPLGSGLISSQELAPGNGLDMPWKLVLVDSAGFAGSGLIPGLIAILLVCSAGCLVTLYTIDRTLRRRLEPLSAARALALGLAEGAVENAPAPLAAPDDEMGDLMGAFNRISTRLAGLSDEMEQRVNRHSRTLEMATRISREAASTHDIDLLLSRTVDLICEEFGLYHAQVYLLDDISLNAVPVYSRGAAGRRLLEQGRKIAVGSQSAVGLATANARPVAINDTEEPGDLPYIPEPLLPETKAQLALPLSLGEQVIGALDLYSDRPNTFGSDEIRIFQLLSDELAIAVHNARRLVQQEQRFQQIDSLNRQLTRNAWEDLSTQIGLENAYEYNLMNVQSVEDDRGEDEGVIEAISAPITIRGEVIGTIAAAAPEGLPFSEGDHAILRAVADRVGLAIEGARLFKETQASLQTTSTLYQLSRYLNEAERLEDIIHAIVRSVMPDAAGGQIWLFDEYSPGGRPEWLELAGDWRLPDGSPAEQAAAIRLYVPDSAFLGSMQENQVKIISDISLDTRVDEDLKAIFRRRKARAVVFVPFSARGTWRGILTVDFATARGFTESEGRIYSALIDQAGVAIDNRLLIQQTEMTLDQIERLYAASRQINTAGSLPELVSAAVAATTDAELTFELGLLEGELDKSGWPTRVRRVAVAQVGQVREQERVEPLRLDATSPLRRREPQIIADWDDASHWMALFPLFSANQPIAILYVSGTPSAELSPDDLEIYKALAGQMSTVLENRRLLQQTEAALDESQRLYAASRAISTAQDSNAVYRSASAHLSEPAPQLSRISILLAGPVPGYEAPYLDVVHVWERRTDVDYPFTTGIRLDAEAAPFGSLMAESGELMSFRNLDTELSDNNRLRHVLTRGGALSALVAPVRTQRNWFGVLICESDEENAFGDQYTRFVQAVTDQIAVAVENRLLFDEAQAEAQRALALAEVGQLATRVGAEFEYNISEVFARVAEPAAYDRWLLMLLNPENPSQLDKVAWQFPAYPTDNDRYSLDVRTAEHSIVDSVRQNRMLIVNDPANYPAFMGGRAGALENIGKHVVTPIHVGGEIVGALMIGRGLNAADLDDRDVQLIRTLAAQIAVAVENRRLFRTVESEREYLRSILETMPTGIIVLDARTFKPIQSNAQAEALLGRPISENVPFNVVDYNLIRTGTSVHYPPEELPIFLASQSGGMAFSDDIAAVHDNGTQTDLLVNAAPVRDPRGNVTAIVAAFQDISNLRGLENALQNNLRETIALYEATRALSEAVELDSALDAAVGQLMLIEPMDGYIVLLDEQTGGLTPVRGLIAPEQFNLPESLFQPEQLMIPDVSQDVELQEETRSILSGMDIRAVATVPLRARDTLLGWVVVVYDRRVDFSSESERFLTTLADNAAVAIDNRNLFRQTEKALEEASTLYEVSRALANASTPEDIVIAAATRLQQPHITHVFMAIPSVRKPESAQYQVVASWQADPTSSIDLMGVTLTEDQFPAWRLVDTDVSITIDDAYTDDWLNDLERLGLESTETRSLAVLPLRSPNQRLGVIWIASSQAYSHTDRDIRIYQSFAEQASLSMEATRLLEQTERRARQLEISAQVSQIASAILDLNELLPRVVDMIRDAFRYDHVQIFLMDETDTFAELKASTGEAGQQLLSIKHRLAKGSASVIGTVTATGNATIALDTADARVVHKPNPYLPLTRSEMALPLVVKNEVVGALDVQSNQPNAFGDEDVKVLTVLASQISVAIDNARLFEEAQQRARDMNFLFTASTAAALPDLSLGESMQSVAGLVQDALEALTVSIYMAETVQTEDEDIDRLRAVALSGSEQPLSEMEDIRIDDPNHFLAGVARTQETQIIANLDNDGRYIPVSTAARSAIATPLVSGNTLVGVIAVEAEQSGAFSPNTIALLGALTSSLSAIVQSARLLQQVQEQNDQLRELDRLKSDFLANMSHELRTPLNSIIGFSRVILKGIDGPLTEMQEQDLSTIYNSGTHLLGLINDILDQAKINSGKMELHLDYFEVKPVVEGVRSIGIGLIKDKPVDLRLEMASGLPKVYGDEFRTRQVLLNLVSNASKFTQKGSIVVRVYPEVHEDSGKTMVRIDVQDSGIGIAQKDIPLLFEAFRQVDSSLTRTVGGTGLGLPIAKSLIEMQGGYMVVDSEPNVGSTFSILIPLEPTPPSSPEAAAKLMEAKSRKDKREKKDTGPLQSAPQKTVTIETGQPVQSNGEPVTKTQTAESQAARRGLPPPKRQMLLIEDDPEMVDQYRRVLQAEGFDIFAASIPLEAEAMASGLRPTIIIMSAAFANGAGWDILKRLQEREDTHDIPVIVASLADDRNRAGEMGAFAFLQRPFTPEQLLETVEKAEQEAQTERILIIDDQPGDTRLLKQVLDENGRFRVFTAASGMEGISMVARHQPNLVILDLRMPEMDGFRVLEELRATPETASIPVMIVTADTIDTDEQGQLGDLQVIYKTNLSQDNYREFIDGIRSYLSGTNGD